MLQHGGAGRATAEMKRTMSGRYLELMAAITKPSDQTIEGSTDIDGHLVGTQTSDQISIIGCENETSIRVLDEDGSDITSDTTGLWVREVMAIRGEDGRWRIDHTVAEQEIHPDDWEDQPCLRAARRR